MGLWPDESGTHQEKRRYMKAIRYAFKRLGDPGSVSPDGRRHNPFGGLAWYILRLLEPAREVEELSEAEPPERPDIGGSG